MWRHVSDAELMDVVEGGASAGGSRHVLDCPECAARVEQARAGLVLAREAKVPEPSPLYWESFGRQLGSRISSGAAEPAWMRRGFAPALALAACLVVALGIALPTSRVAAPRAASPLPAWSALPPAEEDEGLEVLQAMSLGEEPSPLCQQGATECVEGLSEDESLALADALRQELAAKGRL
jgi:hypothetical protein